MDFAKQSGMQFALVISFTSLGLSDDCYSTRVLVLTLEQSPFVLSHEDYPALSLIAVLNSFKRLFQKFGSNQTHFHEIGRIRLRLAS